MDDTQADPATSTNDMADLATLTNGLAELAGRVDRSEAHLDRLVDVVTRLVDGEPSATDQKPAGQADQSSEAEEPLEDWVDQIIERYYLRMQFRGWQDNTAFRAELEALRLAHRAAYGPKADGWAPTQWHDMFARMLHRLVKDIPYPLDRAGQEKNLGTLRPTAKPANTEPSPPKEGATPCPTLPSKSSSLPAVAGARSATSPPTPV
ncbi:hypothetical protein [Parenemella sanctibonifatiensis]|uniref:Uncharacterized protein n=1 Tax=Parenemella sanctibonifatiensis TaxID=2016505 RepID=A0A255EDB6_9ACTN|nr:hypothetical protein [Parenemella sanctibonifatiensis]OYN89548.1 hypothetical protein CGZ91_11755 [Parenemella sanctibonifatiensis]